MIVDIRTFLLVCCLFYGSASLRLLKVSIPAYKLRGESAFLECQYELDAPVDTKQSRNRHHHRQHHYPAQPKHNANDMTYTDGVDDDTAGMQHIPNYPYTRQNQQKQQKQQQQKLQEKEYQKRRVSRDGITSSYYQSQQRYETQEQSVPPIQKSPYGHSVYRGSSSSSMYNNGHVGVGASTYGREEEIFGESAESEPDTDNETEELEEHEQGESLYAIKWYKDNEEFYRYVPKANPPKTSYRVDGVRVIEEHSDSSRVLLRGLTLNSTGLYRCEVSAEAPNFSSVQGEGRMDVVYLPRDGPHIKGQQFQYQIGETLNLNCTSGKSHPASHLQWFINEQPVMDEKYLVRYNDTIHKHGIITSTLGLQLTVDGRHFYNGAMRVKCLASISPVLWKGDKESVLQRRPGIIDNREAMLLVRSAASRICALRWRHITLYLSISLTITAMLTRICQLLQSTELT